MVPYLLKVFNSVETQRGTKLVFLDQYAQAEFDKVFGFINDYLQDKSFLVADRLTGADFMMGFVLNGLIHYMQQAENYPQIQRYVEGLTVIASWKSAVEIESADSSQS